MVMAYLEEGTLPHLEVIQRIKRFDQTRKIPVLLFTRTKDPGTFQNLYQLPVSAVVPLASDTDPLTLIKDAVRYWMRVVQLPLV